MNRFFNILFAILFAGLGWFALRWVLDTVGFTFGIYHDRIMGILLAVLIVWLAWLIWSRGDSPLWKRGP